MQPSECCMFLSSFCCVHAQSCFCLCKVYLLLVLILTYWQYVFGPKQSFFMGFHTSLNVLPTGKLYLHVSWSRLFQSFYGSFLCFSSVPFIYLNTISPVPLLLSGYIGLSQPSMHHSHALSQSKNHRNVHCMIVLGDNKNVVKVIIMIIPWLSQSIGRKQ